MPRAALPLLLLAACSSPPEKGFVSMHGGMLRLHFTRVGSGNEVLIVPGESYLGADMGPLVGPEREILFYDLRGKGRSDLIGEERTMGLERDIADLEALRREFDYDRVTLLGWSYDASVCVLYALRYPGRVERLILVAPRPLEREPYWSELGRRTIERTDPDAQTELAELLASGLREEDPKAFCHAFGEIFLSAYVTDPACLARMRSDPCVWPNIDPMRVARQNAELLEGLWAIDWRTELRRLDLPVLILHGADDPLPLASTLEWREVLPRAEVIILDDVGHMPWLEAPERFFPVVERFLSPAESSSS